MSYPSAPGCVCTPAQAAARMSMMQVQVPPGVSAGQQMIVQAPNGAKVQITLPPRLGPGDVFHVAIPEMPGAPPRAPDPPAGMPPAPAPSNTAAMARQAKEAREKVAREAKERREREAAKKEQEAAEREAAKKREQEAEERKQKIREEAEAFKREMEAMADSVSAAAVSTASVPTESVSVVAPVAVAPMDAWGPPSIARMPSPIVDVPGALQRLHDKRTIQPVLSDIDGLLTCALPSLLHPLSLLYPWHPPVSP